MDTGGERYERRKWISAFDGVSVILFFVNLSEFNLTLEEDSATNRMRESLKLFHDIVNHRSLNETPVILVFNKTDLFREKLAHVKLVDFFSDYLGKRLF